ncbi:hypothetical protein BAE44_0013109 [Dichanthelium oligosanthes]|uniref:Ferredoxin-like protein n=1 Tax=Dichanthelium oligosanthes TaxID=888268 RepID=A0A1E5VL62_9POAL|nr:hypothetical protein BAE44_0013109 [Dichanthelium oligosanthes]
MAMSAWPLLAALLLPALLLSAASAADSKSTALLLLPFTLPLVALVNSNRTANKATSLSDNQGLGCMALQYIKAYEGQCSDVRDKKPMDSSFTGTFATDCGVQPATVAKITGRLVACQSKYPSPPEAFDILVKDEKGLQVLHSKNHTEVGAAVSGTDGGGPYFWCVLFSDGKPATSFKVDGEVPKTAMHPGCFSGNNDDCAGPSNGAISANAGTSRLVAALLFVIACAFAFYAILSLVLEQMNYTFAGTAKEF